MPAQIVTAQRDFSAGQVDPNVKRNEDHPFYKSGLRQCINGRALNTKGVANRFGRSALLFDGPRVEEILMGPGFPFLLCFSAGKLTIRQLNGTAVAAFAGMAWTAANVNQIVWAILQAQIFITFPGIQPLVVTWTPSTTTFAMTTWAAQMLGFQKRVPFYRISPHDITLQPDATATGAVVNLVASGPVFDTTPSSPQIGTFLRYIGRQIRITAITDSTHATGVIQETLFSGWTGAFTQPGVDIHTLCAIGDVLIGAVSGAKLQVTAITSSTTLEGQLLSGTLPQGSGSGDFMVGPGGSLGVQSGGTIQPPKAVTIWDEEVFNAYRGWPQSCFADQQRLGFCNIPRVPSGVAWSAISSPTDFYIPPEGLTADNAIFELAPGKTQVFHILAGAESDEFVFGDNAIYWIPINVQNPLSATGQVVFNKIDEGTAQVQPRFIRGWIAYINAAANQVRAIAATGAYNRPYEARDLSELHRALLIAPLAIAAPDGDNPLFSERYIYVLNADGSVAVGYVDIENGQLRSPPGFVLWNGVGSVTWVAARLANVYFTTSYPGSTQGTLVETLDPLRFMDASIDVNNLPAPLAPPPGKGPLWWMPSQTVTLLDKGLRQMDTYQIDANGFIIPQFIGGEDLTSPQLVAGQAWTFTTEPFIPSAGPGQDARQRMTRRRVARMSVYFSNSTGFLFVRMYSSSEHPGSPPQGTVMGSRRVPTYFMGDDPTQSAPRREGAEFWRPKGRSYDPRVAIIKDTVGPLTILEIGTEVTV